MKAWKFQDARQKAKHGEKKCPWSVGWFDPDGGKRSKKIGSESLAEKYRKKKEGELAAGLCRSGPERIVWKRFRREYEEKIVSAHAPETQRLIKKGFDHFERIARPTHVQSVTGRVVDKYIAKRRTERGLKKGSTVSPVTINKELRQLKTALRKARDWGYLADVPAIRKLREPEKLITYVTPEDFAAIYEACDVAIRPQSQAYSPADWWRALIVFNYMTGWRISEPMALCWDDVSLDKGTAITRHADNKGKRDDQISLHPIVVEHLRKIVDFGSLVFYWPHHRRTLWVDFGRIQDAAGIHLPCHEEHEHNATCHRYGFHDLRRAFATANAQTLSADALQRLMRHRSYTTTQRYINMAEQVSRAVDNLFVPEVLKKGLAG